MRHKVLAATLAAAMVTGLSFNAHATRLSGYLVGGTTNLFVDNSEEAIFDLDNSNTISLGDVFVGSLRLDNRTVPSAKPILPSGDLDAVFSLKVTAVSLTTIEWGFSDVVGLRLTDLVGALPGQDVAGGAMGVLYSQSGIDPLVDFGPTPLDTIASIAAAGTLELVVGLADGGIDFFKGSATPVTIAAGGFTGATLTGTPLSIDQFQSGGSTLANFGAGLTILTNASGRGFEPTTCAGILLGSGLCIPTTELNGTLHDLAIVNGTLSGAGDLPHLFGSTDINGTSVDYYGLADNASFRVEPLPEPGALVLLAAGLFGLAFRGLKRA